MSDPTTDPTPEQLQRAEQLALVASHRRFGADLANCQAWTGYVLPKFKTELDRLTSIIFDPANRNAVQIEECRQQWFALQGFLADLKRPVIEAYSRSTSEVDELTGKVPAQVLAAFDCQTTIGMRASPIPTAPSSDGFPATPAFDPFNPTTL